MSSLFRSLACIVLLLPWSCVEEKTSGKEVQKKRPHVIYILADDLGYGDVGAFNPDGKIKTPFLDQLAKEGLRFTDAHSPSAVCTPTRYGILTGRYSWRSPLKQGVLTGKSKALIPKSRSTVASLMKGAGYHTAFIGKWHLGWNWALQDSTHWEGEGWNPEDFDNLDFSKKIGHTPNDLGFDYAYGHSGSLDMAPYVYVENGAITAEVDRVTEDTGKYTWWRKGPTAKDFVHEQVTPNFFEKAMDYIGAHARDEKPFFMYLALPSPHTPILPTQQWLGKSGLNPYADFVTMVDAYVGKLLAEIEKQGLTDNTLIIFTSDNGCSPQADFEVLREHGHHPSAAFRGHKADIYEGGHRVPFLMRWPARIEANSVSARTICQTDLMATLADLVEVPLGENEGEDSYSMLPLILGSEAEFDRQTVVHHSINGSFAIRQDNFKLIFCPGSGGWSDPKPDSDAITDLPKFQLYDLRDDPSEKNNLYAALPDKVDELTALMVALIQEGRSTKGPRQANAPKDLNGAEWGQIEPILSHKEKDSGL